MAFTAHQLAKMILSRPDITLDQQSGQGLGHKEPVIVEDGCRVWLKFYPPAHSKTSAPAQAQPQAPAVAPKPTIRRAKPTTQTAPEVKAPEAPKAAPSKAPESNPEAKRIDAMEARLEALCKALGV